MVPFFAIKLLQYLSHSPHIQGTGGQGNRLNAVIEGGIFRDNILFNFIHMLESPVTDLHNFDSLPDNLIVDREDPIRVLILDLLLSNTELRGTTFAHFLLGFDTKGPLEKTVLSNPVSDHTCFHVILDHLDQDVENFAGSPLYNDHPHLAERCYHLVYALSANPKTSFPTMTYLRQNHNFFKKHLEYLPIGPSFETSVGSAPQQIDLQFDLMGNYSYNNRNEEETEFISKIHCRAWLLKSVALELHTSPSKKQVRQTQELLHLLFSSPSVSERTTLLFFPRPFSPVVVLTVFFCLPSRGGL